MKLYKTNIFFLLFFIIPIISFDHWTLVTDETFNWETNYNNMKWLLFFTHSNCQKCTPVYDLLNKTMKNYFDTRVGFVYIDVIKCPWISARFNITYVPKLILLEDNYMYNFFSNFNEKNIMNFIDKKKPISSALFKPKGAKLKYIYKTYGSLLSHKINFSMQYYLDKLHIPLRWNKYYTFFFLIIFLIILIIFFIFIFIFLCRLFTAICCCKLCYWKKKSKDKKEKNKENNNEIKQKIE